MPINLAYKNQQGYIALVSAIVISVLLLAITFTVSLTSFYARFNILDTEFKKRGVGLAEACGDTAILKLTQDPSYAGGDIPVGPDSCKIVSVSTVGSQKVIKTQGVFQNSYTNLVIKATPGAFTYTINSWDEATN